MFQLFEKFRPEYIERLVDLNKIFLVSQTYKNVFDHFGEAKVNLLLSDYDDKGLAIIHFKAIKNDKYASIIDLTNVKHKEKIVQVLTTETKYCLYWAIVKSAEDVKKRLDFKYKTNIRRYIEQSTNWRIGADEVIRPALQLTFGELFIILKRGSQSIRVKFEEIEKA